MASWEGLEDEYDVFGMPGVQKIARKPKGVGMELKSLACGDTKCILKLEMNEGRRRQAMKAFEEHGSGCAFVLRLASAFFGTGRTIIADSAFSSVNTLEQCRLRGLYFMGMVKTAHKRFPKQWLKRWFDEYRNAVPRRERGEWIALRSTVKINHTDRPLLAIGWGDKRLKTIVTNRRTTIPGNPSIRQRHRVVQDDNSRRTDRYTLEIKRPQAIEIYFKYFNTIDFHDHLRQGSLRLEQYWKTKKWWHRVFAVVFGIIVTNSFLAYKYEHTNGDLLIDSSTMDFNDFIQKLAKSLIFNTFLETSVRTRLSDEPQNMITSGVSTPPQNCTFFVLSLFFTFSRI